jgi:hypothetical protein
MILKIKFDDKKLQRGFVNQKKAGEIAARNTLNTVAFLSRKNALKKVESNFTLRNNFTKRNIRVEKINPVHSLKDMQSSIGATDRAGYMELQDKGGIRKPKRSGNLAIAQLAARGGSKNKVVSRNLYLKNIKNRIVKWPSSGHSKKSRIIRMAKKAYDLDKFIVYKKNIYRITEFRKSKNNVYFKKQHVYNLSQRNARIKARPWLGPSTRKPVQDSQNIYNSQIKKLLRQKDII